jgi:hypothetical protein
LCGLALPLSTGHQPLWGDLNPKLGISKNVHVSFITTLALEGGKNDLTLFKKLPPYNPGDSRARHTLTVLNFSTINTASASNKYWMNERELDGDNPY